MSYNLVENSNMYVNTTIGTVDLTILETVAIANLTSTKYISGDNNDILCLDTDLGARINIGEIRYYFSSASVSGTVASGIDFYYKNENFESYFSLTTNIGNDYYYTTVSGVSAPRYVRMVHTVSGTSVSGTVVGFNILNDDTVVDFGTDGTVESLATSVSVLGAPEIITTIPVYNDGIRVSTAYVTLEPQGTNADELLTISASEDGPWIGVRENAELLADEDTWVNGNYDDAELTNDNKLTLIDAPLKTTGTYTTKIFSNEDKNSFIDIDIESELDGSMVTADGNKQVKTIELRSTNQQPKDYNICRLFGNHQDGGYWYLYYSDYYEDGTLLYTSADISASKSAGSTVYVRNAVIDSNDEKTYGAMFKSREVNDWKQLAVFTISRTGTYNQKVIYYSTSSSNFTFYAYYLCPDTDGGFWAQLYSAGAYGQGGYAIDQGIGHYLIHFYSDLTYSYRYYTGSSRYYNYMDCVYDTGKLWVVDRTNNMVKLITPGGTTEVNFPDTASLREICATSDGGCWYISGYDLVNLDSTGTWVTTLEDVGTTSTFYCVARDGDGALYIKDGEYVKRIFTDGTVDFSVYVANAASFTQVTEDGIWVRTSDNKHRFVDKSEKALTAANISYSYYPAAMGYSYDDDGHGDHFPISLDTHWNDLEWQEVRLDKYPLPIGDTYHQARITLKSNKPSDVYDVPLDETWTPNDYFTQASGTAARQHRWNSSHDTSLISVYNNNRLRFFGGTSSKTLNSSGKWYVSNTDGFDLQFYHRLPGGYPPPVTFSIYLGVYSVTPGYEGYCCRCRYYINPGGSYARAYIQIYTGSWDSSSYTQQTHTSNYGYNRIVYDSSNGRWYVYGYFPNGGGWKSVYKDGYDLGTDFYVWIYIDNVPCDVEIDSFKFNSGEDAVYFNEWDSPIIKGIYNQKSIELQDVYPTSYKNMYLKASVPNQSLDWVGEYNSALRTWWEIPTNV